MRGLYGIPTRARKSEWYEIEGDFTAAITPAHEHASFGVGTGTLQFQPNGTSTRHDLIPRQAHLLPKSSSYKVVSVLAGIQPDQSPRKWNDRLYLRRTKPKDSDAFWSLIVAPSHVCISDTIIDENGAQYHENLVQNLLPSAKRISWPIGIPDDENGPEPPAVDYSNYDQHVWGKLKQAVLHVIPLEEDQVTPFLKLDDLGIDSLDGVMLWMELEQALGVDLEEDQIEEVLDRNQTLQDIYQWLLTRHDQHDNAGELS